MNRKVAFLIWVGVAANCLGQGTMTFTFEGTPAGFVSSIGVAASGMQFRALPYGNVVQASPGYAPYPNNGTGFLFLPENGSLHGGLTFSFTNTSPLRLFDLVSFDAAEYFDSGATNLMVIGYKPMGGTVTNTFSTQVYTWQSFTLDSTFNDLQRVEIYASSLYGRFSLDNLVISGVPEPCGIPLVSLGAACAFALKRARGREPEETFLCEL